MIALVVRRICLVLVVSSFATDDRRIRGRVGSGIRSIPLLLLLLLRLLLLLLLIIVWVHRRKGILQWSEQGHGQRGRGVDEVERKGKRGDKGMERGVGVRSEGRI
jgi:hypothetical protein